MCSDEANASPGNGGGDFNQLSIECVRLGVLSAARGLIPPRLHVKVTPEDMAQAALARAWQARASFRGTTPGELFSWVSTILHNVIIDELSRLGREKRLPGKVISFEDLSRRSGVLMAALCGKVLSTPSSRLMREERRLAVLEAIERLNPIQRAAVISRYFHDSPVVEIAVELDRSAHAVGMLLQRGLRTLEQLLKGKI